MATIRWSAGPRLASSARSDRASLSCSIRRAPCCTTPRRSSRASRPIACATAASLLFRPEQNARRFQASAERLAMPVAARGGVPARDRGTGEDGRRMGARRRRQPLPAPLHVRQRGLSRRPAGLPNIFSSSSLRRSAPISRAAGRRSASGCRPTTPAPRRAAPAPPNAAATTPRVSSPRPRRSGRAATRSCFSTPPNTDGSRSSAA